MWLQLYNKVCSVSVFSPISDFQQPPKHPVLFLHLVQLLASANSCGNKFYGLIAVRETNRFGFAHILLHTHLKISMGGNHIFVLTSEITPAFPISITSLCDFFQGAHTIYIYLLS